MKTTKLLFEAMLLLGLSIASCKGDKGDKGDTGINGSANVQSINLTASSWGWDASSHWCYATWSGISALSPDVVNEGTVMLYQGVSGNWVALPYGIGYGFGSLVFTTNFQFQINNLQVYKSLSDGTYPSTVGYTQFRLVCIPPSAMVTHPEVDFRNYQQVQRVFNLKD